MPTQCREAASRLTGGQVTESLGGLLAATEHQHRRWVPQHPLLPARPLQHR